MPVCAVCEKEFSGKSNALTCSTRCRMDKYRKRGKRLETKITKAGESKRRGNCVTQAISEATKISFMEVEKMLTKNPGLLTRSGYQRCVWEPVVRKLGFRDVLSAKGKLLDKKVIVGVRWYLAVTRGHMVAVCGDTLVDVQHVYNRRVRLRSLWTRG